MTQGVEMCYKSPDLGMILALDPGSHKCGWAVECPFSRYPLIGTVHIEKLDAFLQEASRFFCPEAVIIGAGTGSARVVEAAQRMLPATDAAVVDERGSTEDALKLYLRIRGGGTLRYLAAFLFRPPLDGYAAWVLLERRRRET